MQDRICGTLVSRCRKLITASHREKFLLMKMSSVSTTPMSVGDTTWEGSGDCERWCPRYRPAYINMALELGGRKSGERAIFDGDTSTCND